MDIEHTDQSELQPLTDQAPSLTREPDPSMSEENLASSQTSSSSPSLEKQTNAASLIQANTRRFLAGSNNSPS
jgi:hypothetical protein